MTDKQPEALRLADAFGIPHWTGLPIALHVEAAAELRRLHEVNAELVEALETLANNLGEFASQMETQQKCNVLTNYADEAFTAIAKAQGDNNA